jgi:hypothetical protein
MRRSRPVLIGKAQFDIPAGKAKVIPVRLNRKGRRLLHRAPQHRLKVKLTGSGVKHREVVLRELGRRRQKRGR